MALALLMSIYRVRYGMNICECKEYHALLFSPWTHPSQKNGSGTHALNKLLYLSNPTSDGYAICGIQLVIQLGLKWYLGFYPSAILWGQNLPCKQTFVKYARKSFTYLYKITCNSVTLGCIRFNPMLNSSSWISALGQ